jgi:hypothetical protein
MMAFLHYEHHSRAKAEPSNSHSADFEKMKERVIHNTKTLCIKGNYLTDALQVSQFLLVIVMEI